MLLDLCCVWVLIQTEEFHTWYLNSRSRTQDDLIDHLELLKLMGPSLTGAISVEVGLGRITAFF